MHLDEFLLATVILLSATAIFVSLFKRLGLGSVLGFLAAGVILGPSGFTLTRDVEELRHFTELGVVLFLFIIGLEMQPKKLWSMRRLVLGLGSLQVALTGVIIGGYVYLLGVQWQASLILGLGFALSSTAFVMQLLGERGEMATEHGEAGFAILIMQDLSIVPLLALVPLLSESPGAASEQAPWMEAAMVVGAVVGVLVVGRYLIPFALAAAARSRNQEAFIMFAMLSALGAAYVMELVGVSMALGAFLMGMLFSASEYRHQIEASVEPFKGVLIALFFIAVGMSIDVQLLFDQWDEVAKGVAALVTLKVVTLLALGLLFGLSRAAAIRNAFILGQCGEFGFVLFGAAVATGLLTSGEFGLALMLVTMTMIVTPLLAKAGDALADRFGQKTDGADVDEHAADGLSRHVVLVGYGRGGRTIGSMLEKREIPFVAFDIDTDAVSVGKQRGHNVHFGDMTNPEIAKAAGLSEASAVVVTVEDVHHAERVISNVRILCPSASIYARAKDFAGKEELLSSGAGLAVPEAAEGILHLASAMLTGVGTPEDDVRALVADFRRNDYELMQQTQRA